MRIKKEKEKIVETNRWKGNREHRSIRKLGETFERIHHDAENLRDGIMQGTSIKFIRISSILRV